ncbi:hypothetical protein MNV49_007573 [Pseudohyphozyma bogoriensis]|nr:hypothetical protein MNV49_007573 [Pseudohyphozyma bogoriensis]
MSDDGALEHLWQLVAPYLPASIAGPLHQLLTLPATIFENPSQLVPILISLLTLYAAIVSLLNSARLAFRMAWFTIKWGAIAAAVGAAVSGYNGWGAGDNNGGAWEGLATAGRMGKSALRLGKQGVEWWASSGARAASSSSSGQRRSSKKSASGRPRTWAKANDDGGWDDPSEVDDADANDAVKWVQDSVLTFLNRATTPDEKKGKKPPSSRARAKAEKKAKQAEDDGDALSDWAMRYAAGSAKKWWDGLSEDKAEDSKKWWKNR